MKSIDKTFSIIEALLDYKNGIGINDLSKAVNIHPSTTHRILTDLLEHGYVSQCPETKRYKLGLKFLIISGSILESLDLRKQAAPFLVELMKETNETVHLSVIDNNEVCFIEKVESQHIIRSISRIGARGKLHRSASGKAMMAFLPGLELNSVLDKIEFGKHLPNTIMDMETLIKELNLVRVRGYSIDDEEYQEGGRCVAAPVFNNRGKVVAAISISGPSNRIPYSLIENKLSNDVIQTASAVSASLGYHKPTDC